MDEKQSSFRNIIKVVFHVFIWVFIFFFPYLMMTRGMDDAPIFSDYIRRTIPFYFIYITAFYLNNNLLIPRLLLKRHLWKYFFSAIALIIVSSSITGFMHQMEWNAFLTSIRGHMPLEYRDISAPMSVAWGRDAFIMFLVIIITAGVRILDAWNDSENSRRDAEKQRVESELQQLRSQINPHFLLNTLNNIYALISFDSDKAQEAVQELSQLLRHVLYDNKQNYTTLAKEMEFMKSYIELMRIRLASNVTVETTYDMRENNQTQIAPLIFISLVENAFKHGISPTEPSYIKILFSEKLGYVRCEIKNSNHRKVGYDKSGSGIGLEQVQKRLDLMYPKSYTWHYGLSNDGKEYVSSLEINTKNSLSL